MQYGDEQNWTMAKQGMTKETAILGQHKRWPMGGGEGGCRSNCGQVQQNEGPDLTWRPNLVRQKQRGHHRRLNEVRLL